jgi:hypothetical protein
MTPESNFVTVYRSADANAEADAIAVRDQLRDGGLEAVVVGDDAPGVVVGTYEVRVPAADAARADQILSSATEAAVELRGTPGDVSHDLDLVTVFSSQNVDAEMESQAIQGILDANGIPAVIVGSAQIPVLPFEVRVPRSQAEDARRILAEATETGPQAAEEAEAAGESESEETV